MAQSKHNILRENIYILTKPKSNDGQQFENQLKLLIFSSNKIEI